MLPDVQRAKNGLKVREAMKGTSQAVLIVCSPALLPIYTSLLGAHYRAAVQSELRAEEAFLAIKKCNTLAQDWLASWLESERRRVKAEEQLRTVEKHCQCWWRNRYQGPCCQKTPQIMSG